MSESYYTMVSDDDRQEVLRLASPGTTHPTSGVAVGIDLHADFERRRALLEFLASLGWGVGKTYFFPVVGRVPDELRHDGPYPGSKGFVYRAVLYPAPLLAEIMGGSVEVG